MEPVRTSALETWRTRLSGSVTPVFARTVRDISQVTADVQTSASDLSRVVSQDASMTARLVRIANSSLFNPQSRSIDTINSAVVLLGFDAVRELSISLSLIEQVLKGRRHVRVTTLLARAFHAATQARAFARLQKDRCPEEIFVAALLYQVGEMTFWSAEVEEADGLDELMAQGVAAATAEQKVLGFRLRDLSRRLAEDWSLGDLLRETLDARMTTDGRAATIALGHSFAQAIETHGLDSKETRTQIQRLCAALNRPQPEVEKLVRQNLEDALRIARTYGVEQLERVLPVVLESAPAPAPAPAPVPDNAYAPEPADRIMVPDRSVSTPSGREAGLLNYLVALSTATEAGAGVDHLMRLLLEAVHIGIGFDRTYFALFTADRRALQAKYVLGRHPARFDRSQRRLQPTNDFFQVLFETGRVGRYHPDASCLSADAPGWLVDAECLCGPVSVNGKPVGVLYADRSIQRAAISDDDLSMFRVVALQIPLLLSVIRKSG